MAIQLHEHRQESLDRQFRTRILRELYGLLAFSRVLPYEKPPLIESLQKRLAANSVGGFASDEKRIPVHLSREDIEDIIEALDFDARWEALLDETV